MFISSDTNVWIDFYEIGHLELPFRLDYQYYMSCDTFREEFLKSEEMKTDLMKYGLRMADVTDEEYKEANIYQTRYPALSLYDSFALAIAKKRGWVLLTGDKPLRKAADKEGVECHGTIWIYDQLKEQSKVTDVEYSTIIEALIRAVQNGQCRLPITELQNRIG
ncbi:MAG: hypothetical protein PHO72_08955 [Sphaerochaeta sp.]|nr:hypothetical protein [Sphaerochaeta sp.]